MLLAHAIALAEVRSYLAALADHAPTLAGTAAYDDVLLYFDATHSDQVPALDRLPPIEPRLLHELTENALLDLVPFGFDPLHLELILGMIDDARGHPSATPGDPGGDRP